MNGLIIGSGTKKAIDLGSHNPFELPRVPGFRRTIQLHSTIHIYIYTYIHIYIYIYIQLLCKKECSADFLHIVV